MKLSMKKVCCLVVIVVMVLITLVGCGSDGNTSNGDQDGKQSNEKFMLGLSTATAGGTYYPVGGAMAQMWTRVLKDDNISVSAQASNGSVDNINRLKQGATELALTHNKVAWWAQSAQMMFEEEYKDFGAVTSLWPNVVQIVVAEDINSINDLKGKRVVVGAINSGNETDSRLIFESLGLKYRDEKVIKPEYVGYTEAAEAIKNRKVSGAMYTGGMPTSAVLDVLATTDSKILSLDDETIKMLKDEYPIYDEFIIPKGTYPGQEEDIKTVAYANLLIAHKDVPEDVVYKLISSFYENLADMQESFAALKAVSVEKARFGVPIPFHPGAEKYLKEKGVVK